MKLLKIDLKSSRNRPEIVKIRFLATKSLTSQKSLPQNSLLGPHKASKEPQERPRAPQEPPKSLRPRTPQERPKSRSTATRDAPETLRDAILNLRSSKKRLSKTMRRATPSRRAFRTIFDRISRRARKRRHAKNLQKPAKTLGFYRFLRCRLFFARAGLLVRRSIGKTQIGRAHV